MGKKSKSKTPREMQNNTSAVEEEKASSSAKKPTSEIDEVFAGKKRKGPETEKAKNPVQDGIEKPSSSAKKRTSEIDEIFAGKQRKKPETQKSKKPKNPNGDGIENPNKLNKKKKDKRIRDGGGFGDLPSKLKKRTQDGLSIYTEEELGINKVSALKEAVQGSVKSVFKAWEQRLNSTGEHLESKGVYIPYSKFQNVASITLHFPDSFGGDTTKIEYIGFKGEATQLKSDVVATIVYELRPNPSDHKTKAEGGGLSPVE